MQFVFRISCGVLISIMLWFLRTVIVNLGFGSLGSLLISEFLKILLTSFCECVYVFLQGSDVICG